MTTVAVIPARYGSTRFPGKPLANQTGKCLVQHVVEAVRACEKVDRVIVATDDERIIRAVESFGGESRLTSPDHPSGTDRVGEVAAMLDLADHDVVLNVQGDEPELPPAYLSALVELLTGAGQTCRIATLAAHFDDTGPRTGPGSPQDPNCVKVVVDDNGRALYFSRSLVPYPRDTGGRVDRPSEWLLHLGVYAFRVDTLRAVTGPDVKLSRLETAERLEQLRWLQGGHAMAVHVVPHRAIGIDTPEDYAAFVQRSLRGRKGSPEQIGTT